MRSPAVLLLLSLAAPSNPPLTLRTAVEQEALRTLPRTYAVTIWACTDQRAEVYPARSLRQPRWRLLWEVVEAHEDSHVADTRQYLNCRDANLAWRDPAVVLVSEVKAFCAGVRVGVRNGWYSSLEEGLYDASRSLSGGYPFGLTIDVARARLNAVCGSPQPGG